MSAIIVGASFEEERNFDPASQAEWLEGEQTDLYDDYYYEDDDGHPLDLP